MDVRQLSYFLAVVDHGGVNRAAAVLHVAQPSLSQAIRGLERDLGAELFRRAGRRLVLTSAGEALIGPARQAVRALATARASVERVRELRVGRVEIAAMPSQSVEPLAGIIKAVTGKHPGLSVAVRAAATAADVVEAVRSGRTELGLLGTSEPLADARVVVHGTGRQRFVLVCPADGPFAPGTAVRQEDLAGHRLIVGQPGTGMRRVVDEIRAGGVELTEVVEIEHREAVLPLVLSGVGVAVLAESWADLAARAGALVLPLEPARHLHVALVSGRGELTPGASAFLDVAHSLSL
ncbi:DNA-binding transcriptional regulator, LysR family [Lentzea fradiae]|uniref:DNA-binding transcriptional regulator, LysR family n=1 Tax=Lentzea fradiae TaxID=200378 RepID=A0A1G7W2C9_9PSEU|nr:LysR family transcriptional regulator [Lentzea fradiae]SDG66224.1 DNA-binding transcriptional regulator, LysR family [Lentzea fradiae]